MLFLRSPNGSDVQIPKITVKRRIAKILASNIPKCHNNLSENEVH